MATEYLCTTADGHVFCPLFGYRVQTQGRYGKWENRGLYCSQEAANFAVSNLYAARNARTWLEHV